MSTERLAIHDNHQLELKLEIPFAAQDTVHQLDVWLFFPSTLGVNASTWNREAFYEDLQAYSRFQTPRMSLERLAGEVLDDSPLSWLARHEPVLTGGRPSPEAVARALRELRLFAATARGVLRDQVAFITGRLRPGAALAEVGNLAEASRTFVEQSAALLARFRVLRQRFLDPGTPPSLLSAIDLVADFLSMHAVETWSRLLELFGSWPGTDGAVTALRAAIRAELQQRRNLGLLVGPDPEDPELNARLVSRFSLLKKYVLGVLHLRIEASRRAEHAQDVLFGLAAGVAMLFALTLQIVSTVGIATPGATGSAILAFLAMGVGGYVVKDRLKEKGRAWFAAKLPHWLYDRQFELSTEGIPHPPEVLSFFQRIRRLVATARQQVLGEGAIGLVEEALLHPGPDDIPLAVKAARMRDEDPLFFELRGEDTVVRHRRTVKVRGELARRYAPEMQGITEILRYSVIRWIRRTDESVRSLFRLTPDGGVESVAGRKSYRVVAVVVRRPSGEAESVHRYDITLVREGLLGIHEVR